MPQPGRRSGSQTPVTTGPPNPRFPAPNANSADVTRELIQILTNYTSQVVNQSVMATMREFSKKAYQKRDTEFNNSQRFHAQFASLADHQANLKEKTRRDF